jgi:hypothetical protein
MPSLSLGLLGLLCRLPAPLARPIDVAHPSSQSPIVVSSDLQPAIAAHVEESEPVEPLTLELQLAITFEVLHRLKMAAKSRLLSVEELDLIEFLVASLSSSLACKTATAELPTPPLVAREVVILQSDPIVPSANPCAVRDALAAVVRSSTPP